MSTTSQKYVDIDLVVFIISETGGSAPCIKAFCAHMLNAVLVATLAVLLKACTCSNHFNRSFLKRSSDRLRSSKLMSVIYKDGIMYYFIIIGSCSLRSNDN